MRSAHLLLATSFFCVLALGTPRAHADDNDPTVTEAREAFLLGVAAVKEAEWAKALSHFERSQAKRKHPVTSYNIGLCHRAVGHYVLARRAFEEALAQNAAGGSALLTGELTAETRALLGEVESAIVHVDLTVEPEQAQVSVDGRPLVRAGSGYLAGIAQEGPGAPLDLEHRSGGKARSTFAIDPGVHTIQVMAQGHSEQRSTADEARGSHRSMHVKLIELPGTLRVSATPPATVFVSGESVGLSPLTLSRPKGDYAVSLRREGYLPFSSNVYLAAGRQTDLVTTLTRESIPVTKRWWFYAILTGAAAALATTTYLIVRSQETTTPDGGSLGWVVKTP